MQAFPGAKVAPVNRGRIFEPLPPQKEEEAATSGISNVLSLYEPVPLDEKVEPAYELRKLARNHARMHPHVRMQVPLTRDGAERWISLSEQKFRTGNAKMTPEARAQQPADEQEVAELFYASREMLAASASMVERESDAAIIFGYLALIACHCAIGGRRHFDHFFDRERNGAMVSVTVLNLARGYARDYSRYKEMQQTINHQTQMAKARYAAIHRQLMAQEKLEAPSSGGTGWEARPRITTWAPSKAELKLRPHPADKVGPTMDVIRVIRGWYEATGAMQAGEAGCSHCGLPHDPAKSVCHLSKFPKFRSPTVRQAFRLAHAAGYINCSDVDEWNGRQGREDADRCGHDGKHVQYKALKHLRKGVAGGPQ